MKKAKHRTTTYVSLSSSVRDDGLDIAVFGDPLEDRDAIKLQRLTVEPRTEGDNSQGMLVAHFDHYPWNFSAHGITLQLKVCLTKANLQGFELSTVTQGRREYVMLNLPFSCEPRRSFSDSAVRLIDNILKSFNLTKIDRRQIFRMYLHFRRVDEFYYGGEWISPEKYILAKNGLCHRW